MKVYTIVMLIALGLTLFVVYTGEESNRAIENRPASVNPTQQQMNSAIQNLNK